MKPRSLARATLALACAFAGSAPAAAWAQGDGEPTCPNELLARGAPTFVRGTAGDDRCDAAIAAQIELIRGLLFPGARVVADDEIDVARGPSAWPANPIVYGGPHVNTVLARLAATGDLPFRLERGRLEVGGRSFEGDEHRLIAIVRSSVRHPAFLLYAGAGVPGVAEINSVTHGPDGVLVLDRFGPLVAGAWRRDATGDAAVEWRTTARRVPWRTTDLALGEGAGEAGRAPATVTVARPEVVPRQAEREDAEDRAILRAVRHVARRLAIEEPASIAVYIYPDRRSKQVITSNAGDGHAEPESRTLHIVPADASEGGPLEAMVAHEATHLLAYAAWGAAGTPLLGEGLAVWVSGRYGGRPLEEHRAALPAELPPLRELLGVRFRRLPEPVAYPQGGLLVAALVDLVGLDALRTSLYGATGETWDAACARAGTTHEDVERAFRRALGR